MSSDANILEMVSIGKGSTKIFPIHKQCGNGIKVETSLPLKDQRTPTGTMSLVGCLETHTLHTTYMCSMYIVLEISLVSRHCLTKFQAFWGRGLEGGGGWFVSVPILFRTTFLTPKIGKVVVKARVNPKAGSVITNIPVLSLITKMIFEVITFS